MSKVNPANPFIAAARKFDIYVGDATLLDWGFFKVQRRLSTRYSENEYHVTLVLPLPKRKYYSPAYDDFPTGRPALFAAFGKVQLAKGGWHARGAVIYI